MDEPATTIPDIEADAASPAGRMKGGPRAADQRPVFAGCQPSFRLPADFPAVIPRFCCRAAMEWPRATLLLTMTLGYLTRSGCESELLIGNSWLCPV